MSRFLEKRRKRRFFSIILKIAISITFIGYAFVGVGTLHAQAPNLPDFKGKAWQIALSWCENRGRNETPAHMDTNGKYSYGKYQFQIATFLSYGKFYGLIPQDTTVEQAKKLVFEETITDRLVEYMHEDKQDFNWKICSEKIATVAHGE